MFLGFTIAFSLFTWTAAAQLFTGEYACAPELNPEKAHQKYRIRTQVSCTENENWMRIYQKQGVWLLVPSEAPLLPEEQEDLKRVREYWGAEN